jgi:hypothetical protein
MNMNMPTRNLYLTICTILLLGVGQVKAQVIPEIRDIYPDTWVGTDAIGRSMPDMAEVGPVKNDRRRVVGIFYITWHGRHFPEDNKDPYKGDVTKILAKDPTSRLDDKHPLWLEATGSKNIPFHWGEPEDGYFLSKDEYVIRKDLSMLADAGVDVLILDACMQNASTRDIAAVGNITVDFTQLSNRQLKPVHGICNGPVVPGIPINNTTDEYKELGVPFVRLHDTGGDGPAGRYLVDISRIFENFDADENNPDNYRFEHTDELILAIKSIGAEPIYRLGESIDHSSYVRYAHPPKDFAKWARICVNIIRHYNDGWANGHHLGLKYWTIWNEPDLGRQTFNGGTLEMAYELYKIAATAIKTYNPELLVGGMSFAWGGGKDALLKKCRDEKIPLDIFSYHFYTRDVKVVANICAEIRKQLDQYGFDKCLMLVDEWNYLGVDGEYSGNIWGDIANDPGVRRRYVETIRGNTAAAFAAAVFCVLNEAGVDIANYYDGQLTVWNGTFNGLMDQYNTPQKPYHVFKAYNQMYRLGGFTAKTDITTDHLYAISTWKDGEGYILLSNYDGESGEYTVNIKTDKKEVKAELYILDANRNMEKTATIALKKDGLKVFLEKTGVCLIKIKS